MPLLQKHIKIEEDVLVQELDNSTVILNLNTEQYYGLDEVGQRIWQLFSEHQKIQIVRDIILQEYDVDPKVLEEDIARLISELSEAKLISVFDAE